MVPLATRVAALAAALAAMAVLGACSGSDTSASATTTASAARGQDHDDTDVSFLRRMIPHHQQTLELAAMVSTNTTNADLITLAQQISEEQEPKIQAFRAQLLQWQLPLADPAGGQVDGLLDTAAMDKLRALHGDDFDASWLQSMITHNQGAITMAQSEIDHGQSTDVISMAHAIVTSRQAEIDQMNLGG